jgi:hypothetical protein
MELRREDRKVARGWQIMSVVEYVRWARTYVNSSDGSAGGRASGCIRGIEEDVVVDLRMLRRCYMEGLIRHIRGIYVMS